MFVILALLIVYSLLTFGAVLPNSWFFLTLAWSVAVAIYLGWAILRTKRVDLSMIVVLAAYVLLIGFLPARIAVGLFAGVFAWSVARNHPANVLRFFKILLAIGILEAFLGLIQFLVSPGWIFGYVNTINPVSGTLINRNHFSGLLEMMVPIALGLAYVAARRSQDMARPYLFLLAGAFIALAIFSSVSRMGILSFVSSVFFLVILIQLRNPRRGMGFVLGMTMMGLAVGAALWIGVDLIIERYSELFSQDALLKDGRLMIFRDVIRMIAANPLGVGIGKFEDAFRAYQTFQTHRLFDHAHNDYLETAAESGLIVAAMFWSFLVFTVIRGFRLFRLIDSPEQRGVLIICTGAICAILVHSLADFNLQIPSNAMLFFTFAGISLAVPPERSVTR